MKKLTSSEANFKTAVKGVFSGTFNLNQVNWKIGISYTLYGNLGSDVSVILNDTFEAALKKAIR